jgi:hypothetical protein
MIRKVSYAGFVLAAIVSSTLVARGIAPDCSESSGVGFRIVTDKLVYAPKSTMRVDFLVTNTEEVPLYFFRTLSQCSSQLGSYLLLIVDRKKRQVPIQRCSADVLMDKLDVVETLTHPKFGILLAHGAAYGHEEVYELPAEKGTYWLNAELVPPGFTDTQREILTENKMRVLQCPCRAPDVTITIK